MGVIPEVDSTLFRPQPGVTNHNYLDRYNIDGRPDQNPYYENFQRKSQILDPKLSPGRSGRRRNRGMDNSDILNNVS